MNKLILAGAAVAALAVPAMAQMAMQHDGPMGGRMMQGPITRAQAEAKAMADFARMDANHDGFVTADEIKASQEAMRTAHDGKMFDRIDTDHNGSISRAEFDAFHAKMPGGDHMAMGGPDSDGADVTRSETTDAQGNRRVRVMMIRHDGGRMLMMADANHDGKVSQQEAVSAALARFDKADANHDGTVTPEERAAAMKAMAEEWRARRGAI